MAFQLSNEMDIWAMVLSGGLSLSPSLRTKFFFPIISHQVTPEKKVYFIYKMLFIMNSDQKFCCWIRGDNSGNI